MTLEEFRLRDKEGVAALAYLAEQGAVEITAVPVVVRGPLQPLVDFARRRVHQENRAEGRNDRLPVAERERFSGRPLICGEHLHRVPAERPGTPAHAVELARSAGRQLAAERLLISCQDVDGERPGGPELLEASRVGGREECISGGSRETEENVPTTMPAALPVAAIAVTTATPVG